MMETGGKFFIGRQWDLKSRETQSEALLYDPDDLTTHAVVVGMTGSGKTGLCIDILEEAALQGIPSLMIDPKGDITNTLLHFPDLLPEDFAPWINPDEARRENKTIEQAAEDTAELWQNGLAGWDIGRERIQALKDSAQFAIYTPGSDAGLPLSIMGSLSAPGIPWDENRELLREQIASTVTALLGLIGMTDIDPVTSREHVLLANIFENAWSQNKGLDLGELIMQIQAPPFAKVGFLETDAFFPQKERFGLATRFNNLVASPSFQAWIEGDPLHIETLLFDESGRPRHTVFYIAHLNDQERMFFVTLFFSAVETWMRGQSGTSTLRSLVYFDEIFGYMPPTSNPPSKEPMLRMLKTARAFGLGLILATQNPVDVDYKALSNAGTWFIGRLATARDKDRLVDGLAGVSGGALDKKELSEAISSLGKRVFVARNVHEAHPALFQTRWAMNYLAGPMTRIQIPAMNELAGAAPAVASSKPTAVATGQKETGGPAAAAVTAVAEEGASLPGTRSQPPVPKGVDELFLPVDLTLQEASARRGNSLSANASDQGLLYGPVLFAQASVLYHSRKYDIEHEQDLAFLVPETGPRNYVDWEEALIEPQDLLRLPHEPEDDARFLALEQPLSDAAAMRQIKADLTEWIYRSAPIMIQANEELHVYADPDVDEHDFEKLCIEAADERLQADIDKLEVTYRRKLDSITEKLRRERRELEEDQAEVARRKGEEYSSYAETLFSFLGGRRRSISSAMSKRSRRTRAEEEVEESIQEIASLEGQMSSLQAELEQEIEELEEKWALVAAKKEEIPVTPYKKDIKIDFFGVAWEPSYLVQEGERLETIPAADLTA